MSIRFQVLGRPGQDNAVLLEIDSGQSIERILFDCGEGCLQELSLSEIRAIDHLCFSHLHMDHVAGFDTWFRANFDRDSKPNQIWGPPQTISILQHRFRGYLWNLHDQMQATWCITEVAEDQIRKASFQLSEAFAIEHDHGCQRTERILFDGAGYEVQAVTMDHLTPVLAYVVREKPRLNIDTQRLKALGLRPGPWLKQLKEQSTESSTIMVDGNSFSVGDLRQKLITETAGDSFAYCTDFVFDTDCVAKLTTALAGCQVMICEAQYRAEDLELAKKHHHMITTQSASLAQQAQVGELILFHLSSRYTVSEWQQMLDEVRSVYPGARFPHEWSTWFENR